MSILVGKDYEQVLMAVLGFGLVFLRAKPGSIAKIACGFLGFLNMVLLFLSLKYDASKSTHSGSESSYFSEVVKISIDFQLAFWLAALLFILGAVLGILQLVKKKS